MVEPDTTMSIRLRTSVAALKRARMARYLLPLASPEYEAAIAEEMRLVNEVQRLRNQEAELTSMDAQGDDGQVFGG